MYLYFFYEMILVFMVLYAFADTEMVFAKINKLHSDFVTEDPYEDAETY